MKPTTKSSSYNYVKLIICLVFAFDTAGGVNLGLQWYWFVKQNLKNMTPQGCGIITITATTMQSKLYGTIGDLRRTASFITTTMVSQCSHRRTKRRRRTLQRVLIWAYTGTGFVKQNFRNTTPRDYELMNDSKIYF